DVSSMFTMISSSTILAVSQYRDCGLGCLSSVPVNLSTSPLTRAALLPAVGLTPARAEVLPGGPFVASLEMTEPEIELGIRPLRVLAHRLAEVRRRLAVAPLRVARDPQPHEGIRPFRVFREGRLELARRLGVAALP